MKNVFNFFIFYFFIIHCNSQVKVHGKVIDKITLEPLEMALVKFTNSVKSTLTNKAGNFSLHATTQSSNEPASISISFIGYQSQVITVNNINEELLVQLERGIVNLQEVIISSQSASTSFHTFSKIDLNLQPAKSAQDILRIVPGLFVGQHQGGGKAEQIFLRGFDIDHGTDINISVDGLPVNMVSHAHGQGYADLHFLIPELVGNIDYGKGPYYSTVGNMGTAGYVSLNTINSIDKNTIKLEAGQFNTLRGLAILDLFNNRQKERGTNAYVASEFLYSDGPFHSPQHFNRFNIFGKFNAIIGNKNRLTVMASTLNSNWDASGQIPERAVLAGHIGRFGAIDDTEVGYTGRTNVSAKLTSYLTKNSAWENQFYFSHYHFNLYSNFSFFLRDSINGDQIRQRESRNIFGYHSKISVEKDFGKWSTKTSIGGGFRLDQTKNTELAYTKNKNHVLEFKQLGDIRETNFFAFADKNLDNGKWLFNIGTRLDHFNFAYFDKRGLIQSPKQQKLIVSPKINVQYTFNPRTQVYVKAGKGFHSNDARVVVINGGEKILPAAYGGDLGFLWKPTQKLLINAAAWYLYLQQEFVYVGDEGIVEPSGKSKRTGLDLSGRYQINKWLFTDVNLNLAKPKSIEERKGENYIPLAPT